MEPTSITVTFVLGSWNRRICRSFGNSEFSKAGFESTKSSVVVVSSCAVTVVACNRSRLSSALLLLLLAVVVAEGAKDWHVDTRREYHVTRNKRAIPWWLLLDSRCIFIAVVF